MVRLKSVKGFTLIELLISMTVMGLVIGLGTYGFSLFSKHWDGRDGFFERSLGELQRVDLCVSVLQGTLPWAVKDTNGAVGFYFLGREEGVTFVTQNGIFSPDAPALVRLFRESIDGRAFQLVYEEAPLANESLRRADQVVPFKHRLVILSRVQTLEFRYFGLGSPEERLGDVIDGAVAAPRWWGEYDGMDRFQHPLRLELNIDGHRTDFPLPDRTDLVLNATAQEL